MRNFLSFLGFLITDKPENFRIIVWGIEEILTTTRGAKIITRKLQIGDWIEDEFYYPEQGKLVRFFDNKVRVFYEEEEGR